MNVRWLTPLAALVVFACDKKPAAEPVGRTAAVIEKTEAPAAPPEIKSTPAPMPVVPEAKPIEVAPKPVEPVPEPKLAEPVPEPKLAEPVPEPKLAEPVPEPKLAVPTPEPRPGDDNNGAGVQALVPDLVVTDKAVTDAIVDRMPSERKTAWKIGEDARLIGWFEFKNPGAAVDLELVWKKNGTVNWRFPTSVGSGKNWRTWAEKRITKKDAGDWRVEVVDANGHVYDSVDYKVE